MYFSILAAHSSHLLPGPYNVSAKSWHTEAPNLSAEGKMRTVMNELAYNLESFNPAFTAVLLKVPPPPSLFPYPHTHLCLAVRCTTPTTHSWITRGVHSTAARILSATVEAVAVKRAAVSAARSSVQAALALQARAIEVRPCWLIESAVVCRSRAPLGSVTMCRGTWP